MRNQSTTKPKVTIKHNTKPFKMDKVEKDIEIKLTNNKIESVLCGKAKGNTMII